jgi:hypothetical protein
MGAADEDPSQLSSQNPQTSSSTTDDNSGGDAEPAARSSVSKSFTARLDDALGSEPCLCVPGLFQACVNAKGPGGFTPLHVACLGTLTAQRRK